MPGLIVSPQLFPQGLRLGLGGFQAPWDSSGLCRLDVMSEGLLLFSDKGRCALCDSVRVAAIPAHDASNSRVLQIHFTADSREWTLNTPSRQQGRGRQPWLPLHMFAPPPPFLKSSRITNFRRRR